MEQYKSEIRIGNIQSGKNATRKYILDIQKKTKTEHIIRKIQSWEYKPGDTNRKIKVGQTNKSKPENTHREIPIGTYRS